MFNRKKQKILRNSFRNIKKDIEEIKKEIQEIKKITRQGQNFTIWFTGLPCSGKTTIAKKLEFELKKRGYRIAHLDGDDVRQGLNADLGFSKKDRNENLRRISHIAQLFNEKGNLALASFVSPTNDYRRVIRGIIKNLKMVYVKCSVEECEKRDVKGMYRKARKGEIKQFTGISAPFEEPENPDIILNTEKESIEESVNKIIDKFDL